MLSYTVNYEYMKLIFYSHITEYFRSLGKLSRDDPNRWDQNLAATMFGLRTKKHLTTQFSPYCLMFGREARYPSEVPSEWEVRGSK